MHCVVCLSSKPGYLPVKVLAVMKQSWVSRVSISLCSSGSQRYSGEPSPGYESAGRILGQWLWFRSLVSNGGTPPHLVLLKLWHSWMIWRMLTLLAIVVRSWVELILFLLWSLGRFYQQSHLGLVFCFVEVILAALNPFLCNQFSISSR